MKLISFSLCLIICLIACETEKKYKLDLKPYYKDFPNYYDNFFNYTITENTKLLNSEDLIKSLLQDSSSLIRCQRINNEFYSPYLTLQAIEYFKDNRRDFLFYKYLIYSSKDYHGVLYQIEYPMELSGRKKMLILALEHYNKYSTKNAAFIEWSSKPINTNDLKYNPDNAIPDYIWGINKLTDTLKSNLSLNSIKLLYPDFQGKYLFKKYKEIIIDHAYSSFDRSLFDKIKFVE